MESGPADALGEGAQRFEQLIESVKRQNAVARETSRPPAPNPLLGASPGEDWARQFQTHAIGPETGRLSAVSFAAVPKRLVLPSDAAVSAPSRTKEFASKAAIGAPDIRFGRPEKPRRSLLSRLFSRT